MTGRELSPSTIAVAAGRPDRLPGQPLNAPITMASALVPGGDTEYARAGNPTWDSFERVLGDLEGGRALGFASGVAASTAVMDLVPLGGIVVAPRGAYAGTLDLLHDRARRGHLTLELIDVDDTAQTVAAVEAADLAWIETPTNPALDLADLDAIGAAADRSDTAICVDNTFATPLRQRPLDHGADFVVHSASKLLSGHSDVILGAVVTNDDRAHDLILRRRTMMGAIPGALETFLAVRGMRTLHVRLDRAEANAAELHARLSRAPQITHVRYPGFGTIISFEVVGGPAAAEKLTGLSEIVVHTTSLGGVESTWERRRRHPAEPEAVPEALVRLSVGLEDVEDLWSDISDCLTAVG
jgi:cystathionine gamma-synthase